MSLEDLKGSLDLDLGLVGSLDLGGSRDLDLADSSLDLDL